jgi:uncharacterized membrane protein YphA (DoxX/SURF4 family)
VELSLLGIRFFLGLAFLTASLPKLAAPNDFRRALRNYRLLPFRLVGPVARWLPRLELMLALALLTGLAPAIAASLAAATLLAFSAAAAINLARGRRIECGCFGGSSPRRITWSLVLRDVVLAGAAIVVAVRPPSTWTLIEWPVEQAGPSVGRDAVALLIVALAAVVCEEVASDGQRLRRALRSAHVTAAADVLQ